MNTYLAQGVAVLGLLAAVRGASVRQSPGGQCTIYPVFPDLTGECLANRTSYRTMVGIVSGLNGPNPGNTDVVTASTLLDVLEVFCQELPQMSECVASGVSSCNDMVQKLEMDLAFAAKSTICADMSRLEQLFETYGNEVVITATCASPFVELMASCADVEGVNPHPMSVSGAIRAFNTIRDRFTRCLVPANFASLSPECDSIPPQLLSLYLATSMHVLPYPGLTFTLAQLQQLFQLE